jgi:predicted nucleic acid-binding protein
MKTCVHDASALFAFLRKTPGAYKVNELLKDALRGYAKVLMAAVNYGEVYGKLLREHGREPALRAVQAVRPLPIELIDTTPQRACEAADIRAKHKLYYAEAFAAALAVEHKATLVSSDSDFRKLGHGFPIVWLKV